MPFHDLPIKWENVTFQYDEGIWWIPSSTYQSFEIAISGSATAPNASLLGIAKEIIPNREIWVSEASDFLWKFIDRSKMLPTNEDWFPDGFRFEKKGQFIIDFSHPGDVYGSWEVEFLALNGPTQNGKYFIKKFQRRQR